MEPLNLERNNQQYDSCLLPTEAALKQIGSHLRAWLALRGACAIDFPLKLDRIGLLHLLHDSFPERRTPNADAPS